MTQFLNDIQAKREKRVTYGLSTEVGREHISSRGKDLKNLAIVGEAGSVVALVSGTNSAGIVSRSGRGVGSILVIVTSSNTNKDTRLGELGGGIVDTLVLASSNRQVDKNTLGAVAGLGVLSNKLQSGDNTRPWTATSRVVENLDTK